jgi:hypothetical protein
MYLNTPSQIRKSKRFFRICYQTDGRLTAVSQVGVIFELYFTLKCFYFLFFKSCSILMFFYNIQNVSHFPITSTNFIHPLLLGNRYSFYSEFSILYGSQNTNLFTFCYFNEKLFQIYRYFRQMISM